MVSLPNEILERNNKPNIEMSTIFSEIDRLTQKLRGLLPMKHEWQNQLDRKFRLEFNYNSNHLEGNTLTYGETELLLIFGKTTGDHDLREYEEMEAHNVALNLIKGWAEEKEVPLNETRIKNLNEIILVKPFWKEAITPEGQQTRRLIKVGDYKEFPNSVRLSNGEIFYYTSVAETPILMGELVGWFKKEEEKKELHPAALAALLHYKFVRIHPFDDGNGRTARLLMNYVLLKNDLPWVVIKSGDKRNYFTALNKADTGDVDAFIQYIAEQLIWSLQLSIKAAKGESIDEPEDLDKKIALLKNKLGEGKEASIQIRFGNQALNKVVKEVITPLAFAWEERLKKFDALFISRKVDFVVGNKSYLTNAFDGMFEKKCREYLSSKFSLNNKKIILRIHPIGLRNVDNKVSINAGEITIDFFENAYEISYTKSKKKINKLYHQNLLEKEIDKIVNDLGNFLYDNIQNFIESHKK